MWRSAWVCTLLSASSLVFTWKLYTGQLIVQSSAWYWAVHIAQLRYGRADGCGAGTVGSARATYNTDQPLGPSVSIHQLLIIAGNVWYWRVSRSWGSVEVTWYSQVTLVAWQVTRLTWPARGGSAHCMRRLGSYSYMKALVSMQLRWMTDAGSQMLMTATDAGMTARLTAGDSEYRILALMCVCQLLIYSAVWPPTVSCKTVHFLPVTFAAF